LLWVAPDYCYSWELRALEPLHTLSSLLCLLVGWLPAVVEKRWTSAASNPDFTVRIIEPSRGGAARV
jgi:hypothetical protein